MPHRQPVTVRSALRPVLISLRAGAVYNAVSPIPDKQTMLEASTTAALAPAEAVPLEREWDSLQTLKELSALDLALIGGDTASALFL